MIGKRKTWKQAIEDAIVRVCRRRARLRSTSIALSRKTYPKFLRRFSQGERHRNNHYRSFCRT